VEEWDPSFLAYLRRLEERKPVILTGDLNVAHLDLDIHNYSASHIKKVPGCTNEERFIIYLHLKLISLIS